MTKNLENAISRHDTYVDARDGTHKGGFSVRDVTNGTDILRGLTRNNFGRERSHLIEVKAVELLLRQVVLLSECLSLVRDNLFSLFFVL